MAYPRKFREKIALQMQKQAEETAAFEAILREVSISTRPTTSSSATSSSLQPVHSQMARSLPNVNQMVSNTIDLQNALMGLEEVQKELKYGNGTQHRELAHTSGVQLRDRSTNLVQKRPLSRDRLRASSPYGSRNYLSPPSSDNNWRRASSDPSLHSSVSASVPPSSIGHSAASSSSNIHSDVDSGPGYSHLQLTTSLSHPLQVPPGGVGSCANSGSLPDLTNLNFPPPLSTPLDSAETIYNKVPVSQHLHRQNHLTPLVFSSATNNHLLAGGCAVVSNTQCPSSPLRDGGRSVFSPLSPQPIITLTDASVNSHGARDEILYSEDFDAIQEYLYNLSSPMLSLSPSFFRLSGSTPPAMLKNNSQSASRPFLTESLSGALPPKSSSNSFQDSKTVCNENSGTQRVPTFNTLTSVAQNGVTSTNRPPVSQHQQPVFMPPQQTLTQWNQVQRELLQLQNATQQMQSSQQQQHKQQQHNIAQHQLHQSQQLQQPHLRQQQLSQQMQSTGFKQQLPQSSQQLKQDAWQQQLGFGQLQQRAADVCNPNPDVIQISEFSDIANNQRLPPPYGSINASWNMGGAATSSGMLIGGCNDVGQSTFSRGDAFNDVSNGEVLRQSSVCSNILSDLHDANSFDFELLASDDASTLGLDPLALEELQMLTDPPLLSDPDIENSFRFDHNFNNYRLM